MESSPQLVVRTIRRALGMTQAEFARCVGWSASTISRWESGRAQPSRLALKIILAFGEERHVRLKPTTTLPAVVALPAPLIRPPLLIGRRSLPPPALFDAADRARPVEQADPTREGVWSAELTVRVKAPRRLQIPPGAPSWLWSGVALGCTLVTLVALSGVPRTRSDVTPASTSAMRRGVYAVDRVHTGSALRDGSFSRRSSTALTAPPAAGERPEAVALAPSTGADAPPPAEAPSARSLSREPGLLAGIVLTGGDRRATVHTASGAFTVGEGDMLGGHAIERIAADRIVLRESSGRLRTIRLGDFLPVD